MYVSTVVGGLHYCLLIVDDLSKSLQTSFVHTALTSVKDVVCIEPLLLTCYHAYLSDCR